MGVYRISNLYSQPRENFERIKTEQERHKNAVRLNEELRETKIEHEAYSAIPKT